MLELAAKLPDNVVARIKEANGNFECPVCYDAVENPAIFVPCGHDTCSECFAKIADPAQATARGDDGSANARCPNCRGPINSKSVIDYEVFKKVHLKPAEPEAEAGETEGDICDAETESEASTDSDSDTESDDSDELEDDTLDGFIVNDDDEEEPATESEAEDDDDANAKSSLKGKGKAKVSEATPSSSRSNRAEGKKAPVADRSKKGKGKGKGKSKRKEKKAKDKKMTLAELKKLGTRNKAAKKKYLRRIRQDWQTSTKIEKALELIERIVNDTDEKVIIFSQWTSFLDVLEVAIDNKEWGYERYDGSMRAGDRANAVDNFKGNKNVRMMLISLKAGNAGLNLNCASQVIILDPFWNPYIEEQAIDRAHRLGQERTVQVHRILIEDSVEDRIVALQEKKRELISQALDENAGQAVSRLSQRELAYLFGVTRAP